MRETDDEGKPSARISLGVLQQLQEALDRIAKKRDSSHDALTCSLCLMPLTLETNGICADENGKVVHETCYVQRLLSSRNDPPDPNHAQ